MILLVHEDGAHDLELLVLDIELLVLDTIFLIAQLKFFREHSDALFQDLIVKRHLLLPRRFLLLVTGGCACRR